MRFILFPSASDLLSIAVTLACVALITSSFVNMSLPVWKFFSVAESRTMPLLFATHVQQGFRGGKKASSFNLTNQISHLKGCQLRSFIKGL